MPNKAFTLVTSLILLLFVIGGRGLSHLPLGPLYVGEVGLIFAVMAIGSTSRNWRAFQLPVIRLQLCFMVWGVLMTVPYISEYGIDSFRDAVLWGYGIYSIAWCCVIVDNPNLPMKLFRVWKKYAPWMALICALSRLVSIFVENIPVWPGSSVSIIQMKGEELGGQIIPYAAYMISSGGAFGFPWIPLALGIIVASTVRAFLVGFALTLSLLVFLTRNLKFLLRLGIFAVTVYGVLSVVSFHPANLERDISAQSLQTHITSIFSDSDDKAADSTREWRVEWWKAIIDYTVFGDYFFTGKGYGINLATEDGFNLPDDVSLRSPHNSHITILARSGIPGLALWFCFLGAWFTVVLKAFYTSKRNGDAEWARLFLVVLAYWIAHLILACFDVFLEGPVGGIWFWTATGVGAGSAAVYGQQRYRRSRASLPVIEMRPGDTGYGDSRRREQRILNREMNAVPIANW